MNFSIQKIDNNGSVTEIITQEDCTVTLNIQKDPRCAKSMVKMLSMLNSNSATKSDSEYANTVNNNFLDSCFGTSSHFFTKPSMLLIDSSKQPINLNYEVTNNGLVGACDCKYEAYSGTSTIRGTINLTESSINIQAPYRVKNHLVIDFPTHASNGVIDKIVFSDKTLYTTTTNSNQFQPSSRKRVPLRMTRLDTTYSNNSVSNYLLLGAMAVKNNGDYIAYFYKSSTTSETVVKKDGKIYRVNTSHLIENKNYYFYLTCIKDNFYIVANSTRSLSINSSGIKLYKLNVEVIDGEISVIKDTENFITIPGRSYETSTNTIYFNSAIQYKDKILVTTTNSSTYETKIDEFDLDFNYIKTLMTFKGSNSSYSNFFENSNFLFNNENEFINTKSIINLENNVYFNNSTVNGLLNKYQLMCASSANCEHNIGVMNGYYNYGHESESNYSSVHPANIIGEIEVKPSEIVIDLKQPIVKTDVETLKLIFDFEFEIE